MSQDWLTFLLQAILLAIGVSTLGGIGPALDAMAYSDKEGRLALAKRDLVERLKGTRDGEPSIPVFKMALQAQRAENLR